MRIAGISQREWAHMTHRERFDVRWTPEPFSGCWLWFGNPGGSTRGYGSFTMMGKFYRAHRASWLLYRGPIPDGLYVCHHCDTPACVNPDHLYLGTPKQNSQDAVKRGHWWKGKLTPDEIEHIKSLKLAGHAARAIALLYDVSTKTVRRIYRRFGISSPVPKKKYPEWKEAA